VPHAAGARIQRPVELRGASPLEGLGGEERQLTESVGWHAQVTGSAAADVAGGVSQARGGGRVEGQVANIVSQPLHHSNPEWGLVEEQVTEGVFDVRLNCKQRACGFGGGGKQNWV
jgi:hypothetical protein